MFLTANELDSVQTDIWQSLVYFLPELILCGGIVLMLLVRLFKAFDRMHLGTLALVVAVLALGISVEQWRRDVAPGDLFSRMLVNDRFTVYLRLFLYSFVALIVWLS